VCEGPECSEKECHEKVNHFAEWMKKADKNGDM